LTPCGFERRVDPGAGISAIQGQAHDDAVALFESYSTKGAAGPLKEFVAKKLRTLKQHQMRELSPETAFPSIPSQALSSRQVM
jgi:hypothetical protein